MATLRSFGPVALLLGLGGVAAAVVLACKDDPHRRTAAGRCSAAVAPARPCPESLPPPDCDDSSKSCTPQAGCEIDEARCGSKSTCMPLSDNKGKDVLDLRIRRLNIAAPAALASPFIQNTVVNSGIDLAEPTCGENGKGLFTWLLRVDKKANTLVTGGAPPVERSVRPGLLLRQLRDRRDEGRRRSRRRSSSPATPSRRSTGRTSTSRSSSPSSSQRDHPANPRRAHRGSHRVRRRQLRRRIQRRRARIRPAPRTASVSEVDDRGRARWLHHPRRSRRGEDARSEQQVAVRVPRRRRGPGLRARRRRQNRPSRATTARRTRARTAARTACGSPLPSPRAPRRSSTARAWSRDAPARRPARSTPAPTPTSATLRPTPTRSDSSARPLTRVDAWRHGGWGARDCRFWRPCVPLAMLVSIGFETGFSTHFGHSAPTHVIRHSSLRWGGD